MGEKGVMEGEKGLSVEERMIKISLVNYED
jgi:hypothetical protein